MTDKQWADVAASLASGGTFSLTLVQAGLELKPKMTFNDVRNAAAKAFKSPPFETERHIEKFAVALEKILQAAS